MFQKAERKKAKLRLALDGASGSGKTTGALLIAAGLGGRVALVDTEAGSASLYADQFAFDVMELSPPYEPERYIEAIRAAEAAGYDVLILDSITPEWSGDGGCLDIQSKLGGRFQDWAKVTPRHNAFLNAMLRSRLHIIATIRSKTEYLVDESQGKRGQITKQGAAPQQRDGIEYEFTAIFTLNQNHIARANKDRTRLFDGRDFQISRETGQQLTDWLEAGIDFNDMQRAKVDEIKTKVAACKDVEALTALYREAQTTIHPTRDADLWEDVKAEFAARGEKLKERAA
jgi:hypothetical protein